MGCEYYNADDMDCKFGEDSDIPCLCSVDAEREIDREDLIPLALLGLWCVLAHKGEVEPFTVLPGGLPKAHVERIYELIGGR